MLPEACCWMQHTKNFNGVNVTLMALHQNYSKCPILWGDAIVIVYRSHRLLTVKIVTWSALATSMSGSISAWRYPPYTHGPHIIPFPFIQRNGDNKTGNRRIRMGSTLIKQQQEFFPCLNEIWMTFFVRDLLLELKPNVFSVRGMKNGVVRLNP